MTADEFVKSLKELQPTEDQLRKDGILNELIDEIISGYDCVMRSGVMSEYYDDVLLDLINRYDVSSVQIGFIRFNQSPLSIPRKGKAKYVIIAAFDADYIAVSLDTGGVVLVNGDAYPYIITPIAKNGTKFLDSLIALIEGTNRSLNNKELIISCVELSGTPESVGFFEVLCG